MARLTAEDLQKRGFDPFATEAGSGTSSGVRTSDGIDIPKPGIGSVAKETIKRTTGMSVKGVGQIGEDIAGKGGIASRIKAYGQELVDENPQQIGALSDIVDRPGTAITEVASQFVPNIAGALVGGKIAEKVLGAVPHPLAKTAGRAIGALAPVFTQEVAEIRGESPQDATGTDMARQYGAAGLASVAELVGGPEAKIIKGLTPIKGIKQVGREALTQAAQEGAQEVAQTGVERFGKREDLTSQAAVDEYLLSGALGALGGGVVGGGMAGVQSMMKPEQSADPGVTPPQDATVDPNTGEPFDPNAQYPQSQYPEVRQLESKPFMLPDEQARRDAEAYADPAAAQVYAERAAYEQQKADLAAIRSTGPMGNAVATGIETGAVQDAVAAQQAPAMQAEAEQQSKDAQRAANAAATVADPMTGEAGRKLAFADWYNAKGSDWDSRDTQSLEYQALLSEYQSIPGKPLAWTKDPRKTVTEEVAQAKSLLSAIQKQGAANGLQDQGQNAQAAQEVTKPATPLPASANRPVTTQTAEQSSAVAPLTENNSEDITGEKINRKWTEFDQTSGTLGIDRAAMPQIKSVHRGAMVNFLNARGITSEHDEVLPTDLKATQREFSPEKVEKAKGFIGNDRSILVSSDGHVLDGHHQWLAKRESGQPVRVIRLDAPIRELLTHVSEFPSALTAKGAANFSTTGPAAEVATPSGQAGRDVASRGDGVQPVAQPGAAVAAGQDRAAAAQPAPGISSAAPTGATSQANAALKDEVVGGSAGKEVARFSTIVTGAKGGRGVVKSAETKKRINQLNQNKDGIIYDFEARDDGRFDIVGRQQAAPVAQVGTDGVRNAKIAQPDVAEVVADTPVAQDQAEAVPGVPVQPSVEVDAPKTAAEWANEMQRLRDIKPRPIEKLYGKSVPTPEQAEAHAKAMREWKMDHRKASKEQKEALERDNAAFRAKQSEGGNPPAKVVTEGGKPLSAPINENQIDSSPVNNELPTGGKKDAKFSRNYSAKEPEYVPNLIVQHNLSAKNLLHAMKMGGIPVPSLAITKKDNPLSGFGEITLIGSKHMADPKGYANTRVFGADIYSPRYPKITLSFTPNMKKRADAMLSDGIEATGTSVSWSEVSDRGVEELASTAPVRWMFLKSKGIEPKIVNVEPKQLQPELMKYAGDERNLFALVDDPEFVDAVYKAHEDMLAVAYGGDADSRKEAQAEIADLKKKSADRGVSYLVRDYANSVERYNREKRSEGTIDRTATNRMMESQIYDSGLRDEVDEYAADLLQSINPDEKLFQGFTNSGNRRYIPHTLENVVKILKKELRGGEGFNYGVGSIRAKFTPQFKSVDQIRKSKDRLIDKESFEKIKDEIGLDYSGIKEGLRSYHQIGNEFRFSDTMDSMMYDAATMGIPRALRENGFNAVPTEYQQDIAEFLGKLKTLPTEYFEAKILRDVDLAEFSGAIVPEGTDQRVIDALKSRGVTDIKTYKGDDKARAKAIRELAEELQDKGKDTIFSRDYTGDTITVDGVERPRNNSNGKPIAETDEGLRNFWKWFKDSVVVDKMGRPLVVHHYSDDEITTFDRKELTKNTASNTDQKEAIKMAGVGFWFADRDIRWNGESGMFASEDIPVYLNIQSPRVYRTFDSMWGASNKFRSGESWKSSLKSNDVDGIKLADDSEFKSVSFVVFDPEQIKSASYNSGAFDGTNPDIRYSRTTPGAKGMPAFAVKLMAARVAKALPNAPKINVSADWQDVPKALRDQIEAAKQAAEASGKPFMAPSGAFHEGTVYLFANGLPNAQEAERVLLHELTHYGFRGVFGKDANAILTGIYMTHPEIRAKVDAIMKRFSDLTRPAAVEEILADMGGDNIQPSIMDKLVAFVRRMIRGAGFKVDFNDAELRAMVGRSLGFSKRGSGDAGDMLGTAFQRVWHGGPNLWMPEPGFPHGRPRLDKIGTGEGNAAFGFGWYSAQSEEVAGGYQKTLSGLLPSGWSDKYPETARAYIRGIVGDVSRGEVTPEQAARIVYNANSNMRNYPQATLAKEIAEAVTLVKGSLYQLDIPDEVLPFLLDWDRPLSQQTPEVRKALEKAGHDRNYEGSQIYHKIAIDKGTDKDASEYLASIGIFGNRYLDGQSRNRPLKDIKREFLAELPEDADFNEVADLIGTGTFSLKNDALLRALVADDWLGFDYPAQAVSAALSSDVSSYDASPELLRAIDDAKEGGTYNFVIWDQPTLDRIALLERNGEKLDAMREAAFSRDYSTGLTQEPIWSAEPISKMDTFLYEVQDKHIDTKRIIQAIQKQGKQIADEWNVYIKEALYHGRTAKKTEDFLRDEVEPVIKKMAEIGATQEEVDEYLHARHAIERNRVMKDRNPDRDDNDGLSGMTDEKAREVLAKAKPGLAGVAKTIDAMIAKTRQELVEYGLEKQTTVDSWAELYEHYVPLQREGFEDRPGTGMGFAVRGSSTKEATGSHLAVENILAHIAMQREKAIVRGEKNLVATALYGLAQQFPNSNFWKLDKPAQMTQINPDTGMPEVVAGDMADYKVPRVKYVGKDGTVQERVDPNYKGRDNVMTVRVNGEDRAIIFNEQDARAMRMVESLKNLDADRLGEIVGGIGKVTRYIASMATQYNPVFGVINLIRDTQTGALNLSSTELKGKQVQVMKAAMVALKGIYQDARAVRDGKHPSSPYAKLWEEFQSVGGQTGYRDMFRTSNDRAEAIEKMLDPEWWQKGKFGKAITLNGILAKPEQLLFDKVGRKAFNWLSDYNLAMENAMRLGAYKVARENGMSKDKAAFLAKGLTVNFNKKGKAATQASALYAFFNASAQGTARIAETLHAGAKDGQFLGKTGKAIVYGGIMLGAMNAIALMMAGFDDDEPPEFMRERNLIIPMPGTDKGYVSIPMPLGFHVLPNIGRVLVESAVYGNPLDRMTDLLMTMLEAFNPIGTGASLAQTISPTVFDPVVALSENKDWTGKNIYREDFSKTNPTPGFTRTKDSASALSKGIAEAINTITGGTDYQPGRFSPTPDQIDYLIGQVTGGVGREITKVMASADSAWTGEELPMYKVPLAGRLVGTSSDNAAVRDRFYDNVRMLNMHEAEIKGRREKQEPTLDYIREHPETRFIRMATATETQVRNLQKRKRQMIDDGKRESVKLIDMQIAAKMRMLNDKVDEASHQ